MNLKSLPFYLQKEIKGVNYFMLADTMAWLKGKDVPELATTYKRKCSPSNIIKYKDDNQKGKPRIYVNIDGLKEIVDKTQSVKLDYKRLLGLSSGGTRAEHVFRSLLDGFFSYHGIEIKSQVACEGYFIDFVIGGILAVEYDEDGHASYFNQQEEEREAAIKTKFNLVRVSDRDNEGLAMARVFAEFKKLGEL